MRKCAHCRFTKADMYFAASGNKCLDCRAKDRRETNMQTRSAVLGLLGGKCVCCGTSHQVFLDLDHINNDGAQDRRKATTHTWRLALREPHRFQILCRNCNWAKYMGGCPHRSGG